MSIRALMLCIATLLISPFVFAAEITIDEDFNDIVNVGQMRGVPVKWDLDANFAVFEAQVKEAGKLGADILITPECWLDGYAAPHEDSTPSRLREIAQPLEGSNYLDKVAQYAKDLNMWICFGFSSIEDGKIFNTCGLWNREGQLVGVYHKTHIQTHDRQYSVGMGLPVYNSEWGKLGMMICADRRWPETVRTMRVQGARLILNPTYGSYSDWNLQVMQVRAWENQCFIAFTHPNQSLLVDPGGDIVTRIDDVNPGVTVTEIDLREAKDNNHIQDRRPEIYTPLTQGTYNPEQYIQDKYKE
jgi:beta-ureidopropionase